MPKEKVLFRIEYEDTYGQNYQQHIFCNGFPNYKWLKKRLNMIHYCGHEMKEEDYKEFIIDAGEYINFHIESIEKLDYLNFDN